MGKTGISYPDGDGTTLSRLLSGQRVGLSERRTPVSTTNGKDRELGNDNGGTDGCRDFLGGLDAETDVTFRITDDDDGLETGTLTGTGLLLDGLDLWVGDMILAADTQKYHIPIPNPNFSSPFCPRGSAIPNGKTEAYLHDLILQLGQEEINNLVLFDRQRVEVDLLHALDLSKLNQSSEFGNRLPLLLVVLGAPAGSATSAAATATVAAAITTTSSESSSASALSCSTGGS